jgi:hypothetical protein
MEKGASLEGGLGEEEEDDDFMSMDPFVPQEQLLNRPVGHGVSKRVEDGRRSPARRAGHPQNGRKGRPWRAWVKL